MGPWIWNTFLLVHSDSQPKHRGVLLAVALIGALMCMD